MYELKKQISKMDVEVILALADCGFNPSRAARKLNVHRNTVIYHIGEIRKFTGLDPLDFFDMITLWKEYGAWCSRCKRAALWNCYEMDEESKFCPHCGAQMDEKGSD